MAQKSPAERKVEPKSVQRLKYSFSRILTGSDLSSRRLALMEAKSIHPGPMVWLTGCVHGDEVGGMVVIQEIFRRLRKRPLLKGSLSAFPLMNPIGFETASRHIGVSKEDLNRSFPGNLAGSVAERIAHKIFSSIVQTQPALVLDLHNDWIKSIPYALVDPNPGPKRQEVFKTVKRFAGQTGFLVIHERESDVKVEELKRTLTGSLLEQDVPALSLELGEAYVVNEMNVTRGVNAAWKILVELGMAAPAEETPPYQLPVEFGDKLLWYSHQPRSSSSGVIRFMAKPGDLVKQGQPIARIYNVFGKLQETLLAPRAAIVLGHADTSLALPGLPVMAFGIPEP